MFFIQFPQFIVFLCTVPSKVVIGGRILWETVFHIITILLQLCTESADRKYITELFEFLIIWTSDQTNNDYISDLELFAQVDDFVSILAYL